jgi:large subunit ribosomal protein L21
MHQDMFAIVEVAGQQFKVEKDENIFVHRLQEKEGDKIVLDQVLLVEEKGKTLVGTPVVKDYQVKATVITHLKGDKVKVFKKKRRKGYQKLNGHRQYLTEIRIDAIEKGKAAPKKAAAPKAEEKKAAPAAEAKAKTTAKATAKSAPKAKAAPKKTEAKTGTVKKTTKAATAKKETTAKAKKPAAKKSDNKKEEK